MPTAIDLLRQGRNEELWQMCCGFLNLSIREFMNIQNSLLLEQLELLNHCQLGEKIMRGAKPKTIEEFRHLVPLTTYEDYCPELSEQNEEAVPGKTDFWVHSSGWSGEYTCKWVPITQKYCHELSIILYGVGILSCCHDWGDTSQIPKNINLLYSVAPRPYISGTFADVLRMQTPLNYMPSLEEAENLSFEERLKLGCQQALSKGIDYFFGLSLVLASVGERLQQSSQKINIASLLRNPKALYRIMRGMIRSHIAKRPMLPKDLWNLRGIIGSGVDSLIYKERIKELWGRYPLDLYSSTEGGVIATQTWDYEGMTFVPNLNFLEFIPEEEYFKWQMDRSYKPETLLLDEVESGRNYEIVLTNLHGGALMRYRIGDMIKITEIRNDNLGIDIPQMVFERRVDDCLDFYMVRITEKMIWQSIEKAGIAYEDWMAYKEPGEQVLQLFIELKNNNYDDEREISSLILNNIIKPENNESSNTNIDNELMDMADFDIKVNLLPKGTFNSYIARKQIEGADPAHLKPPHISLSKEALSQLLINTEDTIVVTKVGKKKDATPIEEGNEIIV